MCGIAGIFSPHDNREWQPAQLARMIERQRHRGPDAEGSYINPAQTAGLGHNRLSIIDLSEAGRQPLASACGRWQIAFNGEIYNYLELRRALSDYPFRTGTDTEVILAAYEKWGADCLERFIGMFAFLLWDEREQCLFAARDRFGVKPLYYAQTGAGTLYAASEIKALHAAGWPVEPDETTWATYLTYGLYEHSERTFWRGIAALPPGQALTWQAGQLTLRRWYDLAERTGVEFDTRPVATVQEEYLTLLQDSVRLRFRSDRPAGINLSGGLDSSLLLGLVQSVQGQESEVKAFTFVTGDERYDELPWVQQMLAHTRHPSVVCQLQAAEVPALAAQVQSFQDEPFGGLPTLAYVKLFQAARDAGVIVLLDGQGIDEQWCGYDYYETPEAAQPSLIQGTTQSPVRPDCLTPEFRALAQPWTPPQPFPDRLRNLQYRDARFTKIPRALRFNDRASMQAATELREPFLDHRLFELALRQPSTTKLQGGVRKWLPRQIARQLLPDTVVEAPKRPVQTPQREWLAGPLRAWANECIATLLARDAGAWMDRQALTRHWQDYQTTTPENSFFVWQWISLALLRQQGGA